MAKTQSWSKWLGGQLSYIHQLGQTWGLGGYMVVRYVGWCVLTTGIVTLLPLMFELKREIAIEEFEKMQINMAIAEGRTPQELAHSGITAAVNPAVLSECRVEAFSEEEVTSFGPLGFKVRSHMPGCLT